ncbi:MAG: hypothetical protein JW739_08105 [Opitutales bacterium]|nr:hypothetical protein [Opitutales bacterium]
MSTVVFNFHCKTQSQGRIRIRKGNAPEPFIGTTPRITKLMALALKFEKLIQDGDVTDYADLARLGHVTRARITQIMGLLNLASDIQEDILFLPQTTKGRGLSAREILKMGAIVDWQEQRKVWERYKTFVAK